MYTRTACPVDGVPSVTDVLRFLFASLRGRPDGVPSLPARLIYGPLGSVSVTLTHLSPDSEHPARYRVEVSDKLTFRRSPVANGFETESEDYGELLSRLMGVSAEIVRRNLDEQRQPGVWQPYPHTI